MSRRSTTLNNITGTAITREIDSKYDVIKAVSNYLAEIELLSTMDLEELATLVSEINFVGVTAVSGSEVSWDPITKILTVPSGSIGPEGPQGPSGEALTLISVIDNGDYTITLNFSDNTSFTTSNLRGVQGLSAYQIAIENGFTGTEEEWVDYISPDIYVAGESISGHTPVYVGADNLLHPCTINDITTCKLCIGVSKNASVAGGDVEVVKNGGYITHLEWAFAPNSPVYIGDKVVTSNDNNSTFVAILGYSSNSNSIVINIQPIILKG